MLRPELCYYSDTYIVVKGIITVTGTDGNNRTNKMLTFNNNAPFRSCISKINNTFIDNTEDPRLQLEYSDNCSMTSESLQNYCSDEMDHDANEKDANSYSIDTNKTAASKYFEYKLKAIGSTPHQALKLFFR